jgi:mRNA interferase RelE/StbE
MTWSVRQTQRFARQYKKLHDNTAGDVDTAVDEVAQNPEIGECKKGNLAMLRVFSFPSVK